MTQTITDGRQISYATETEDGVVIKATDAEVLAGVEDTKYITSKGAELAYGVNHTGTLTFTRSSAGTTILPVPAGSKIAYVYGEDNSVPLNDVGFSGLLVNGVIDNIVLQEGSTSEKRITWNGGNAEYLQGGAGTATVNVYFFSSL